MFLVFTCFLQLNISNIKISKKPSFFFRFMRNNFCRLSCVRKRPVASLPTLSVTVMASWCHLLGCRVIELVLRCPCEAGLGPTVAPQLFDEFNQFRRHVTIFQSCCHGTQLPFIFLKRDFSKYCASALCPSTSLKTCLVYNELQGQNFSFSLIFPGSCTRLCI